MGGLIYYSTSQEGRDNLKAIKDSIAPIRIIAPFGVEPGKDYDHTQVITQPDYAPSPRPFGMELRTNNHIHAKAWIGERAALIGSWNFRDSGFHELCVLVGNPDELKMLNKFFDKMWEQSTPFEDKIKVTNILEML